MRRTTWWRGTRTRGGFAPLTTNVDIGHALEIAAQHRIYAYDAYFLECAIQTRSPLLTLDMKMKAIAESMKLDLITLGEP